MAHYAPVPSETEPTSFSDMVNDCRQVAGTLAHTVIDLTRVPLQKLPLDRLGFGFGAMPVEITEDLLVTVNGLEDY